MAELLHGSTWKGWVKQAHPMVQMLFPNNDAVFYDDSDPIHTAGAFSQGLKSMNMNFSIFHGQHNHQISTSLNHSDQFWRPGGTDFFLQHF
jgi:hypothetical protein